MKYIDEFRNGTIAISLSDKIAELVKGFRKITIMEVCGSHTMSVYRYGLKRLLPPNIRLLSGPGCPVCVTPVSFIDTAITILHKFADEIIITTFGDLFRAPGSSSSLEKEKAKGALVVVVCSTRDAMKIAEKNIQKHKKLLEELAKM